MRETTVDDSRNRFFLIWSTFYFLLNNSPAASARLEAMMEFELARSLVNSRELVCDRKTGNGRQKPMNYGEWSNSRELFDRISRQQDFNRMKEKIF